MTEPSAEAPVERPDLDDAPPFLGSWRNIYIMVVVNLLVLIAIFALLTYLFPA